MVVFAILLATLLSGTQAGSSLLVQEPEELTNSHPPGTGNATVRVESLPDHATIEEGDYGAGTYYLAVPPAQVTILTAEKKPILTYKIRLPTLRYVRSTVQYLSPNNVGPMTLVIERDSFSRDRVREDVYQAELVVLVRVNGEVDVVAQKNITVTVE